MTLANPVAEPEAKADPHVILTSSPLVAPAAVRIVADHHSLPLIYPHHLAHPWIYPGLPAGVVLHQSPPEVVQANL